MTNKQLISALLDALARISDWESAPGNPVLHSGAHPYDWAENAERTKQHLIKIADDAIALALPTT